MSANPSTMFLSPVCSVNASFAEASIEPRRRLSARQTADVFARDTHFGRDFLLALPVVINADARPGHARQRHNRDGADKIKRAQSRRNGRTRRNRRTQLNRLRGGICVGACRGLTRRFDWRGSFIRQRFSRRRFDRQRFGWRRLISGARLCCRLGRSGRARFGRARFGRLGRRCLRRGGSGVGIFHEENLEERKKL